MSPAAQGPLGTKLVPAASLHFDYENPRLTEQDREEISAGKDETMISALYQSAALDELLLSIVQNGYLPFDEMVVTPQNGGYRVLEGNRRLAAIRLLSDAELAARLNITPPALGASQKASLANIPVRVVGSAAEARAYIGFKHVNGPQKMGRAGQGALCRQMA